MKHRWVYAGIILVLLLLLFGKNNTVNQLKRDIIVQKKEAESWSDSFFEQNDAYTKLISCIADYQNNIDITGLEVYSKCL